MHFSTLRKIQRLNLLLVHPTTFKLELGQALEFHWLDFRAFQGLMDTFPKDLGYVSPVDA